MNIQLRHACNVKLPNIPIKLVPSLTVTISFCHFFHRPGSSCTEDHTDADVRGCSSGCLFRVRMHDALHSDWSQQQWGSMLLSKESHAHISLIDISEHGWDNVIVIESFPICTCGFFARSSRAGDIVEVAAGELLLGCFLELVVCYRERCVLECAIDL